ncbi:MULTISPECIES: glutaredoxin domain-containing protein [Pantoea]
MFIRPGCPFCSKAKQMLMSTCCQPKRITVSAGALAL